MRQRMFAKLSELEREHADHQDEDPGRGDHPRRPARLRSDASQLDPAADAPTLVDQETACSQRRAPVTRRRAISAGGIKAAL